MTTLRAAVIGVGFVGKAHLESLRRQGIPVQGVLASSPDRSQHYRDTLRVDRAYTSLDELISDKSVDVVHVCTPNNVHFEESKAALEGGKHVMCEKPLAMDTGESARLIEIAKNQKGVGGVTYNLR